MLAAMSIDTIILRYVKESATKDGEEGEEDGANIVFVGDYYA